MGSSLRNTIQELSRAFASSILSAIRAASFEEILEETGRAGRRGRAAWEGAASEAKTTRSGRLMRRSAEDIGALVDRIVALLADHPDGMRAEQIRDELGLESKELPRPLADGLAERRITKSGQKRATTYFAGKGAKVARVGHASKRGAGNRGRKPRAKGKGGGAEPTSTNGAPTAA